MSQTTEEPFLPFAKPSISQEAINEVLDCFQSGWLTTGPKTLAFEEALKSYFQAPHALTVTSATAGLFLALKALDLKEGDEVITTAMTFVATFNTIVQAGGRPVAVDIDPKTYNIDMDQVRQKVTPRTKAIVPVHFAGLPVDLDPLYDLARECGIRIIEDCAHAIGSSYKGRRVGSFGDIQVFSFHPNKNMTTGEGGCVVTRDDAIARRIEVLRFHGMDRMAWNRFTKKGSQHYDVIEAGYKYNMMDLQAALGIHQLKAVDGFNERRHVLAQRYLAALSGWSSLEVPQSPQYEALHSWHLFAIQVTERDQLMQALKDRNIGTGLHYQAPHLYSFYRENFGYGPGDCPHAERMGNRVLSLPLFPDMTEAQQDRVIVALREVLGE